MFKNVLLLFVVIAVLFGCASFQPRHGMSYAEFKRMTARSFNGHPVIVGMNGTTSVYYVSGSDRNIFYWFESDSLTRIEQGQLPQIRYQIEHIEK